MNYYNEFDPKAAAWLRELIKAGEIPPGDVDERSIIELTPDDLAGYTQHHFFAGIGGWSLALKLAGWPEDRPVRTGSCPCQPFSAAGKQLGTADSRHLWPVMRDLIAQLGPATTFGEQVASALGREWLAGVRADLEGLGYAVGAADLCAASAGAPHIRQRLFWVAHSQHTERRSLDVAGQDGCDRQDNRREETHGEFGARGKICAVADSLRPRSLPTPHPGIHSGKEGAGPRHVESVGLGDACSVADANGGDASAEGLQRSGQHGQCAEDGGTGGVEHAASDGWEQRRSESSERRTGSGRSKSPWADARWLACTDGKARRIEPSAFPLAHGIPGRVGLLRGYGNAIVPQVAAEFVSAYLEAI